MRPMRTALVAVTLAMAGTLVAATPAAAVPDLIQISAASWTDSAATKWATAPCPAGTSVLGGGASISGGSNRVQLTRLQASAVENAFLVTAEEVEGGWSGDWLIHAWSLCGDVAGLEYVSFHSGTDSSTFRSAGVTCPGTKDLLSVGGRIYGGSGQVALDDLLPATNLRTATITAYEDGTGYSGNWSLWGYGVCGDATIGAHLISLDSPFNSSDKLVHETCPWGEFVHGMAVERTGAGGRATYTRLSPTHDLQTEDSDMAVIEAVEVPGGIAGSWQVTVLAICAP